LIGIRTVAAVDLGVSLHREVERHECPDDELVVAASPSSRSVALLWYTLNVSLPSPPKIVVACVTPGLT
jgi:hypothetical protein